MELGGSSGGITHLCNKDRCVLLMAVAKVQVCDATIASSLYLSPVQHKPSFTTLKNGE